MTALIISGGFIDDYEGLKTELLEFDSVICCDGGLRHAKKLNIYPDVILGDFDSLEHAMLSEYKNSKILQFPCEKDETDTEIALNYAIENGFEKIIIIAALGGRFDHSLANLHILYKPLKAGVKALILDCKNKIFIAEREVSLTAKKGELVSLFPLTNEVKNVCTKGLKYELKNRNLKIGSSLGISNVFIENEALITFDEGILIVVLTKD